MEDRHPGESPIVTTAHTTHGRKQTVLLILLMDGSQFASDVPYKASVCAVPELF